MDCDGEIARPPVEKTRKFEDISPINKDTFLLRDSIPQDIIKIKNWICVFLSREGNFRQTASDSCKDRNLFIFAVLKLTLRLMDYGVYTKLHEVEGLLVPLIAIINNVSPVTVDKPRAEGEDLDEKPPPPTWRFESAKDEVRVLMLCKLEVCRILNFITEMRINLRLTQIALTFRSHLDAYRSKNAEEGTYSERQLEQYAPPLMLWHCASMTLYLHALFALHVPACFKLCTQVRDSVSSIQSSLWLPGGMHGLELLQRVLLLIPW